MQRVYQLHDPLCLFEMTFFVLRQRCHITHPSPLLLPLLLVQCCAAHSNPTRLAQRLAPWALLVIFRHTACRGMPCQRVALNAIAVRRLDSATKDEGDPCTIGSTDPENIGSRLRPARGVQARHGMGFATPMTSASPQTVTVCVIISVGVTRVHQSPLAQIYYATSGLARNPMRGLNTNQID